MFQIILVDDDHVILMGLEKIIKKNFSDDVEIFTFLSPEEALTHPVIKKANLVITDISMGEMTGLEFLSTLKTLNSTIDAIVISAHHDFKFAQQSIDLQVLSYLTKPVDFKALLLQIERVHESKLSETHTKQDYPEIIIFLTHYIETNYMKNITLKSIADEFHYNSSYLGRIFNKHLNKSFNLFLQETRINASKKMLEDTALSIDDISYLVGFPYSSYFSTTFKEFTGMTPLKYKQQLKKLKA